MLLSIITGGTDALRPSSFWKLTMPPLAPLNDGGVSLDIYGDLRAAPEQDQIHEGEVLFPLSAFEPGDDVRVTIIAIPSTRSNIIKTFGSLDLRAIQ